MRRVLERLLTPPPRTVAITWGGVDITEHVRRQGYHWFDGDATLKLFYSPDVFNLFPSGREDEFAITWHEDGEASQSYRARVRARAVFHVDDEPPMLEVSLTDLSERF